MRSRVLWLVLSLCLGACQAGKGPRQNFSAVNAGILAKSFLKGQLERQEKISGLQGIGRVLLQNELGQFSSKQIVVAGRPARLRLETLGLFNQRLSIFATDGEKYAFFQRGITEVERNLIYPRVLLDVMGIPVSPETAVSLLLGIPPIPWDGPVFDATQAGEQVLVAFSSPEGSRRIFVFDLQGKLVKVKYFSSQGLKLTEISYEDFHPVGNFGYFAHRISMASLPSNVSATVSFREVELNPQVPEEIFGINPLAKSDL